MEPISFAPDSEFAYIDRELGKSVDLVAAIRSEALLARQLVGLAERAERCLRSGGKILFAGNGGSAADAQHWAGELVSRFYYDRPGLAAIALTVDTSVLTAIGNDYGYEFTFSRQIEALGRRGDIFIGLSTSGRSPNILRACRRARDLGLFVVGMTGRLGGSLPECCDLTVRVPADETPRIQEGHEILGHLLCALIERRMFPQERADR